ncbi:MAG: ornithine cyclodeaminase family protein [bacterium]|jgi:ornithine cyclodeaminase/alanine dehydrogenase-like protein (mu-crystallin family)
MNKPEILFLKQEDVIAAGILDMEKVLPLVERSFALHGEGHVLNPTKTTLLLPPGDTDWEAKFVAMPLHIGDEINQPGLKWAAESLANQRTGELPMGIDVVILSDAATVLPVAIMDGTLITAMRTAAAAGIAAKYLARPGAAVAGVVGAGVIGRTLLLALPHVLPDLREVKLFDLNEAKALALAAEFAPDLNVSVAASTEAAIAGSDAVFTATTAKKPFVRDAWLGPGSFYAHLSAWEAEAAAALNTDRLIVDDWAPIKHHPASLFYGLAESGRIKDADIVHLRDIVTGHKAGRTDSRQRIFYASRGLGCQDIIVARQIYQNAKSRGLGQTLRLWDRPFWL